MAYKPRVGKTRWRSVVAASQQRNRELVVDLERLIDAANNAETRNALLQFVVKCQANLLDLAELSAMTSSDEEA
jgi:hypothetical protein